MTKTTYHNKYVTIHNVIISTIKTTEKRGTGARPKSLVKEERRISLTKHDQKNNNNMNYNDYSMWM